MPSPLSWVSAPTSTSLLTLRVAASTCGSQVRVRAGQGAQPPLCPEMLQSGEGISSSALQLLGLVFMSVPGYSAFLFFLALKCFPSCCLGLCVAVHLPQELKQLRVPRIPPEHPLD